MLADVVLRGAELGIFAASPADQADLDLAALTAWSMVHGLTMLIVDKLSTVGAEPECTESIVEAVLCTLGEGVLRR